MTGTDGLHEAPRCHSRRSSEHRSFTTGGQQLIGVACLPSRTRGDVETDASFFEKGV